MRFGLFSAALLTSTLVSATVPIDGWYSNVFGGYSYIPNNLSIYRNGYYFSNDSFQSGYNVGGRFGYKSNPLRYEGEVTYINGDLSSFKLNNARQSNVDGSINDVAVMANIYYDFPEAIRGIEPYLGFGIGYNWVRTTFTSKIPTGILTSYSNSDTSFAYQGLAGLSFNYIEYLSLNIEYRYLGTNTITYLGKIFQTDMVSAGVTYRFDGNRYK